MSLEAAIMGFLAEEPRSGYDLKTRCFQNQAGAFWTADQAQIYRTLERLKSSRMVACTRRRQSGKPDRKIYRLTSAGEAALAAWLASPSPITPPRDSFLLQVFFSADLADDRIVENLSARRQAHQSRLDELRSEVVAQAEQALAPERTRILRAAAFDGAIARERASIDWLDDTIEAIASGHLPAGQHRAEPIDSPLPKTGSA